MFIARSTAYYPGFIEERFGELSDEIIIPAYYFNNLMQDLDDSELLLVNIINIERDLQYMVSIGAPHNYDKNTIFVPQWILDLIGLDGNSDELVRMGKVQFMEVAVASRIVIKPLDSLFFDIDIIAVFEKALINLHTIREGITVPITIPEFGPEHVMFAHIERVEPAPICRIVAGEVAVDFINEFQSAVFEEPVVNEEPAVNEEPVVNEEPAVNGEPMVNGEPAVNGEPMVNDEEMPPVKELSAEERREQVRTAWLKRFASKGSS